jgi:hypothetical protein
MATVYLDGKLVCVWVGDRRIFRQLLLCLLVGDSFVWQRPMCIEGTVGCIWATGCGVFASGFCLSEQLAALYLGNLDV